MIKETTLSRSLRLMFSGSIALSIGAFTTVHAQEAPDTTQMQRVEITGSSIKRSQSETALQVQTVTHEDILKLGVTSVEQLLTAVTANSAVGGTNAAQGAGISSYGESNASLRGLGASKTLVLVNGRRLANYATDGTAVDINSIPLASVDHVEILKDGASGVYGSDAIGGVINFILRQNFNGVEASAYGSATKDGGGASTKASIIGGWGDFDTDHYNITVSGDVGKDYALYGAQRSYATSSWSDDGYRNQPATPSGALRTMDLANPSYGSSLGNPLSPGNCAANGSTFDPASKTCKFNSAPYVPLAPEVVRTNLAASFRFKLNDNNEFFVEGFHSHQLTTVKEQPSPYHYGFLSSDTEFAKQGVYPAIILTPSSFYYPSSYLAATHPTVNGQSVAVSYRAFDGGGRQHEDSANQSHMVLGMRGVVKGYDYDLAYVHNSSNVAETTQSGYQSEIALVKLLNATNGTSSDFNPFTKYQNPALAAKIQATNYVGGMIDSTLANDSLNGKISGDLYQLPAGMLRFAVGASLADENLSLNPSAAFQSADISGYGAQVLPISASRNSSAIFGELSIPILKTLESDFALRTDKYPNATSTNPKISFRFQPIPEALFRASYGRGFRIAALPELFNPTSAATSATFVDPANTAAGPNQYNTTVGGNPNLKPEKSEQASIGFVLDPVKGLSVSLDYWTIGVTNLVTTLDPEFIVDQANAGNTTYQALVKRDSSNNISNITSTNINAGSLKTAGIDLDVRWQIIKTADYGTFGTHLNGTYVTKYTETLPDGTVQPSIGATIDSTGQPLNAVAAGGIIFRWRDQISFDWKYQNFGASLVQNFQSGYYDSHRADTPNGPAQHVGAFSTWDVQGSYKGFKNLTLRAGTKNLFNRLPPQAITSGSYFQGGYDPSYYDAHGMTGYLTATYKF